MSRLRIRVELSRGGLGVPLHKLASMTAELHKFLSLLTEDIHVEKQRGEWLVFDFDRENLNFTAEYVGLAGSQHVEAFNAAFDGQTSLRRETISQFLRIADAIGEDEVIGFGLYTSDDMTEPAEWRCLSRRDALRMAGEVQMLMGAGEESHLPAVSDPSLGARMFGDRRERSLETMRAVEQVREVEYTLSNRIQRLEHKVEQHDQQLQDFGAEIKAAENSFRNLLETVESFCEQATHKIESLAPAALPAPKTEGAARRPRLFARPVWWIAAVAASAAVLFALWAVSRPDAPRATAVSPAQPALAPPVAAAPQSRPATSPAVVSTPPAATDAARPPASPDAAPVRPPAAPPPSGTMLVELEAIEETWVSLKAADGTPILAVLLPKGALRSVSVPPGAKLRVGNAAGLRVRLDGNELGPLGLPGRVRDIEFRGGDFAVSAP